MAGNSNVVPFAGGKVPAALQNVGFDADDLSSGVTGAFAVVSFRSNRWRIKYQGEEHPLLNADGDPVASLELVILKANPHITKNFYEQGYSEGAAEAPDCYSLDGIHPDAGAPNVQAEACAKCPKNQFGSRITPAGKKAKACSDNRRLAVVPAADLRNDTFGGPMLLRVPAMSLADLALMGKKLKTAGFPYNAVTVRIGFDMDASFPKLTFRPVRPLAEDEGQIVRELLSDAKLERVLAEAIELDDPPAAAAPEPEPEPESLFEQPTPTSARPAAALNIGAAPAPKAQPAAPAAAKAPAAKPAAAPKAAAKPAAPKAAAAAPATNGAAPAGNQLDADIKDILAELGDLS